MGDMRTMPDNIDRLKQLLFDSEAQTLAELSRNLETLRAETGVVQAELITAIKALGEAESRSRGEIAMRVDALADRVGSDANLEHSVALILDGALRKAEQDKHGLVSDAIAPFVVNTVRTEIRNSRDELVEALYPVTGRIVKAYVASAMKDLVDQINRRLESNPLMLRIRSLTTGRSIAELAISDAQQLHVEELYLIRRGSGELIGRWPEDANGANRDQVMSGVLSAINAFASEALGADGHAMRHIDLGANRFYLRDSQTLLLAAKCSGSAPAAVERVLDGAFLTAIGRLGGPGGMDLIPSVLRELSETLVSGVAETQKALAGGPMGVSPVKLLAWLIGLPLVGLLAWNVYYDYRTSSVLHTAQEVLGTNAEIKGYPTRVSVGWLGQSVTVSGLVPTMQAKARVLQRLSLALPSVALSDEIAVVPNALADVEPELEELRDKNAALVPQIGEVKEALDDLGVRFEREAHRRDIERTLRRLLRAKGTLEPLLPELSGAQLKHVKDVITGLSRSLAELDRAGRDAAAASGTMPPAVAKAIQSVTERTRTANRVLADFVAAPSATLPVAMSGADATAVGHVVTEAEQIEIFAVALSQTLAVTRLLPTLSPREKLEAWTRANAIFFSEGTEYRDPASAKRKIRELAGLMTKAGTVVRIIGYTDGLGGADRNTPLSQSRADKVAADLRAEGVPNARIAPLGRALTLDISPDTGAGSPNRRAEFEVGFEGEAEQAGEGR